MLGQGDPPAQYNIGARNAEYALQALALEEIPIVAQKLKPNCGTKISFDNVSGQVILRALKRINALAED